MALFINTVVKNISKWYNKDEKRHKDIAKTIKNVYVAKRKDVDFMYSALDIAKYIITVCLNEGRPISNLQLQKILYFLWVDFFDRTQERLFSNDICAWQLGPVVPNVYYEYNHFAGNPIRIDYSDMITQISPDDMAVLNEFMPEYVGLSAYELVERSHADDSPWALIFKDGEGNHERIPFELIERQG